MNLGEPKVKLDDRRARDLDSGSAGPECGRAGSNHTCILIGSRIYCWGLNDRGQLLGNVTTNDSPVPVAVMGVPDFRAAHIALGDAHTCASGDYVVYCWGANDHGQLGIGLLGGTYPFPERVWVDAAANVTAGYNDTCAELALDGSVSCWGLNDRGQLGDGTTNDRLSPRAVESLSGVTKLRASLGYHVCALSISGSVSCWGSNQNGQLGDRTTNDRHVPATVRFF